MKTTAFYFLFCTVYMNYCEPNYSEAGTLYSLNQKKKKYVFLNFPMSIMLPKLYNGDKILFTSCLSAQAFITSHKKGLSMLYLLATRKSDHR